MDRPSYGYSADDSSQPQGQPVCPRHPDQVTYVRCQRCDRPTCGQCQRPAAVGVLCVDCDRELAQQQRSSQPRNAMGGRMQSRTPYFTYAVMAVCGLFYLGQIALPGLVEAFALFAPYSAIAMPWTFITSGFLHGGIMHLILNLWALWVVGQYLELTMGRVRFAAVYLASIIGGHTAVFVLADPLSQAWVTGTLGASGGVFGLFGSLFIVNRRVGAQTGQVAILIVLNLIITFTVPNISWQGHLGGLLLGTGLTAAMFALRPKATPGADRVALARRSAAVHAAVIVAGVVLCLLLIGVKIATAPPGFVPLPGQL